MQYIVYNQSTTVVIVNSGSASGDTVTYVVYDEAGSSFATGSAIYVGGYSWKVTFTPTTKDQVYTVVLTNTTKSTQAEESLKSVGVIGSVWDSVQGAVAASTGIANVALARLGATRISAIDEDTENARLISAIYGTIRDEVLRAHPWNFAIKRCIPSLVYSEPSAWVTATAYVVSGYVIHSTQRYRCLVAHTSGTFATDLAASYWVVDNTYRIYYEYDYSHSIPSDSLRVLEVTDGSNVVEDFENEDGYILSDNDVIYIKYIYRITDTSKYDAYFLSCFALRLAAELAYPITAKADVAESLMKEYYDKLDKAKAINAQESGAVEETGKDEFLESRA